MSIEQTDTAESAWRILNGAYRSGMQAVWIREVYDWSAPEIDNIILRLASASRQWREMPIIAIRDITSVKWLTVNIGWVADCSKLLSKPTTVDQLRKDLMTMSFRPRIAELFVRDPHITNVRHSILDALFEDVIPDGRGWIYSDRDHIELMPGILGAVTPWGVRRGV